MKHICCFLFFFMLSAATGQAQETGGHEKGFELANNVCSECHATRQGQPRSPNSRAPTFVELANTPGMTVAALTVALTTPHAGMPMFMLSQEQRQDVIAYVLSLKVANR
ncbi:MAG TPA: cytochrome c [Xanthobacteraceae bacterium]|jgi:mono/diheme cytochrome c family protein